MGSESKNKSGGGGGGAAQVIPAATKKVIQNLKEIVNCTDFTDEEIYAVLGECDMDPNRAVEKLLAQDTFHEVKSKRERRKEKEVLDSRSRGSNVGLSRGGKTVSERITVQRGPTYMNYNEPGEATDKEEMGSVCPAVSSSSTRYIVKYINSDSFSTDNGRQSLGTGDSISASTQIPPAVQPYWVGVSKGHLSMADIVRMGRPQKSLQLSNETSHASEDADWNCHPKASGVSAPAESESSSSLHSQEFFHDKWPVIEQPLDCNVSHSLNMSASLNANMQSNHSDMHGTTISVLWNSESDAGQVSQGDVVRDNHSSDYMELASKSSRRATSNSGLTSYSNYNLKNTDPYEHQQGSGSSESSYSNNPDMLTSDALVNVSSAVSDLQQLSLRNSKLEVPPSIDNHTVVLPSHLVEALAANCSHLSFGTYNHGINSASCTMLASNLSRSEMDEKITTIDGSSAEYLDARNSVHHGDEQCWFDIPRETAGDKNYDFLTFQKQEPAKHIISEATLGHEYTATSSFPDRSLQNTQWPTSPLPSKKPDFHGGTFSRDMRTESNFIPDKLLVSTTKSLRDPGFLQSSLHLIQSQAARYSNEVSSISSPAITRPEAMKPGAFALPQRFVLPQDLTVQPSLYLEQVADMRGYHSLHQNRPPMTSINSQHAFSGSTAYNQSLPDIPYYLPQNRSNTFTSRLPSASDSFVYGNPGSSPYNPESFLHNQSVGSMMPSSNFDGIFPSQYDGVRNFSPSQLQGSLSPWDFGAESRSLPRTDFRGQSNHAPSEYINSGFSDPYSQSGLVAELKRLNGSQDLTSKQSNKVWQHIQ